METDVPHKVRQTPLPKTRPLMPLFEAVVNSIHAVEDRRAAGGEVTIVVRRRDLRAGEQSDLEGTRPIDGFVIADNGCGFDPQNYASFGRSESSHKISRGGKGVGRFMWLAAFKDALITSVYEEGGDCWKRIFRFSTDVQGAIEAVSHEKTDASALTGSVVELREVRVEVARLRAFPRDGKRVAELIAEHCTGHLLRPACPKIRVRDGDGEVVVNDLFRENSSMRLSKTVQLKTHEFTIHLIKSRPPSGDTPHKVRLCADYREVKTYSLQDDLPHLPKRPWDGEVGRRWVADVYVSGPYLDRNVDSERARFRFEDLDAP